MRAEELNVGDLEQLELTLVRPEVPDWLRVHQQAARAMPRDGARPREVFLRHSPTGLPDRVVVHSADGSARAEATADDEDALRRVLGLRRLAVTWVAQTSGARLFVHVHVFGEGGLPGDGLAIGVDDAIMDRVREELRDPRARFAAIRGWLMAQLSMPGVPGEPAGQVRVVHSSTPTADGSAAPSAFTLLGNLWAADVALRDERPRIIRLLQAGNRRGQRWPRLSRTALSFVDASTQEAASEAIQAALAGLVQEGKSYLDLWRAYDELEWEVLLHDAAELGVPGYSAWRLREDGTTWNFSLVRDDIARKFLRQLQARDGTTEIEAAENIPAELTGVGRAGQGRGDRAGQGGQERGGRVRRGGQGRAARGIVQRPNLADLTIDVVPAEPRGRGRTQAEPPGHGVLFLALSGNRASQNRRRQARDRIWSGTAEMHGLAQLIEGVGIPSAQARSVSRYGKKLDRIIRESFATGTIAASPTASQERALRMALKTPDLLLVQGPPGTGKTQFITALLRCLDTTGESARVFNRALITSYQHDAVDNMVKARNRGLPPARVDSNETRARQSALQLRTEILQRVQQQVQQADGTRPEVTRPEAARPEVARRQRLRGLLTLMASYDEAPSTTGDLADILDQVATLAADALPPELAGRLAMLRARAASRASAGRGLLVAQHGRAVRAARSLRAHAVSFADDGPDRAARALAVLDELRLLDSAERELLGGAATWTERSEPPFLHELAALRVRLLVSLGGDGRTISPAPARDPEVQTLLHEAVAAVERHLDTQPESVEEVLADYLTDLGSDISLIQEAIGGYSAVLAATVQQTDSPAMYRVIDAPVPAFGTVIVDEAARANPLDLMIPMSCARDRIVLVGDHRQLPHAMERKIEQELRRSARYADTSRLQQSLFQRWFDMFQFDSPRLRTITLDEQFRMHPELGRFVSTVFYGSPTAVRSHPSTRALTHDLDPYRGKVAAWIDVPHDGAETRAGYSVTRRAEAKRVVAELVSLADQDTRGRLSFGIISFYKGQVDAIQEELLKAGLLVPDDTNASEVRPVPRMAWTDEPTPRPRLRVGTVDAFQGAEFDVVLLSVARSSVPGRNDGTPEAALRRYGHLTSDQRMCVAMSGQRRLLLAVGDAAMADRAVAPADPAAPGRSLVEGLVAFLEFCEGPHGAGVRS